MQSVKCTGAPKYPYKDILVHRCTSPMNKTTQGLLCHLLHCCLFFRSGTSESLFSLSIAIPLLVCLSVCILVCLSVRYTDCYHLLFYQLLSLTHTSHFLGKPCSIGQLLLDDSSHPYPEHPHGTGWNSLQNLMPLTHDQEICTRNLYKKNTCRSFLCKLTCTSFLSVYRGITVNRTYVKCSWSIHNNGLLCIF